MPWSASKGWSETKIARWLQTQGPRPHAQRDEADLSLEAWCAFLDQALTLPGCRYVGLLQHFYRHSTHDESFTITARQQVTTRDLRAGLPAWDADVLYEVHVSAVP